MIVTSLVRVHIAYQILGTNHGFGWHTVDLSPGALIVYQQVQESPHLLLTLLRRSHISVDLYILNGLSVHLGAIQIHHPYSLPPPLWCEQKIQICYLGSHVPRLWLPIQQRFDPGVWVHPDQQILEHDSSRPLHCRDKGGCHLRYTELRI